MSMHILVMVLLSVHALAGVFWVGSTLALTHSYFELTPKLFRAQMLAAALAVAAGLALWGIVIRGAQDPMAHTLALGALFALVAAGVQGSMRRTPVRSQRIAAVLLSATVVCMVIAPYVT
ncbi:MAG: hypothetical protein M0038_16425 [Pseudomonadota bacterium]|jgi:hypothetical protein|nr:hypothetical protein [Pseudomonadota bacterium]